VSDDVGTVVITYSPGPLLRRFADSLDIAAPGMTLVVSDNGSTDGAPEELVATRPGTILVVDSTNPGYGAAANAGVARLPATVRWVLICNPDTDLSPDAIERMRTVGDADERIGALGPRIRTPDGLIYPSARRLPSFRVGVGHGLFASRWRRNPWTRRYLQEELGEVERPTPTGWLSGSCLMVRRTAFEQVGGFDPGFFMYFEDVDLGKRLGDAGWRNVLVPDAEIVHVGGATTSQHRVGMLRAHHESAYRYLQKKYPQPWMRPALWAARGALRVRLAVELRRADR
jgi:N-acetylglucosaminyl-diphospho-decaprenol L-rhamnosyltransferase